MTIKVSLIGIEGLINELQNIEVDLRQSTKDILVDSAKIIEKNIKNELRSPKKSGVINLNQRSKTSFRRSAPSESLAFDQGVLEQLIDHSVESPHSVSVGFLKNTINKKGNYAELWEKRSSGKRPTLQKALEASLNEIDNIVDKKIKLK